MDMKITIDFELHKDPENWESVVDIMKTKKTMKEILGLFQTTFPGIVVGFMDGYSADYPHLTEDWEKVVNKIGVKRTQVMILDNVSFDENHNLVKNFCECFTRSGFSVRRKMEFVPCQKTGVAIPSELNHYIYKKDNRIIPDTYMLEVSDPN